MNDLLEDAQEAKRNALLNGLRSTSKQEKIILGQQKLTLSGIGIDGKSTWKSSAYGTKSSDMKAIYGEEAAMIGIDIWDLALKDPTWGQPEYSKAIRDFYDNGKGGIITLEWHTRSCDDPMEKDRQGIPAEGGSGSFKIPNGDWSKASDRSCLCRIVNKEPWQNGKSWEDWLYQKLDRFAATMVNEKLQEIPIIFRPFHEMNGAWFWWGQPAWDCHSHLKRKVELTGAEAYKALFRKTVDYLRHEKKLKNLVFSYATDKLCEHPGSLCKKSDMTDSNLKNDYLYVYPGSSYVDILGIDLYYPEDETLHSQTTESFIKQLKAVTAVAKAEGKIAALTEVGSYDLHKRTSDSKQWFTKHFLKILTSPGINLSYALLWENRYFDKEQFFIPPRDHADSKDFANFLAEPRLLLKSDLTNFYNAAPNQPEQRQESPRQQPQGTDYPPKIAKVFLPTCVKEGKTINKENFTYISKDQGSGFMKSSTGEFSCLIQPIASDDSFYPQCSVACPTRTQVRDEKWGWCLKTDRFACKN